MSRFYIADTHFGHRNILKFKNHDGTSLRPFSSVEEMDEFMVSQWNSVVNPQDTVYHLGDVCMSKNNLVILERLNGRKILIRGNHDTAKLCNYSKYFVDVRSYDRKKGIIATHIPIHPQSLGRFGINVHGHTHNNILDDPRYFCVSVERIGYRPMELTELHKWIEHQWENSLKSKLAMNGD